MAQYVAAIDQGTTSTRCIIFDRLGNVVGSDQREHRQILPQPGWVEHAPLELWERTQEVLLRACEKSDLSSGIWPPSASPTSARPPSSGTARPAGRSGAIVWRDTRTDQICAAWHRGRWDTSASDRSAAGNLLLRPQDQMDFYNVPGVREASGRGPEAVWHGRFWLVWNLTGVARRIHVTDVTNASRTLLMNLSTLDWDPDLLSALEIPAEMLPRICPSSAPLGYTTQVVPGVPIAGILGDQQAALFGQACFSPGEAKNTYGTGCFLLLNTGNQPVHSAAGLLTTVGYQLGSLPAVYCLEGSIAIAGALVQWLRDNLKLISSSGDIEPLARTVEDNGGAYIVPAFSGLFAPYWRSDARGVVTGLTRFINRGHLARAVLEATAYQTADVVKAMEVDSGVPLSTLKVDGGMVRTTC